MNFGIDSRCSTHSTERNLLCCFFYDCCALVFLGARTRGALLCVICLPSSPALYPSAFGYKQDEHGRTLGSPGHRKPSGVNFLRFRAQVQLRVENTLRLTYWGRVRDIDTGQRPRHAWHGRSDQRLLCSAADYLADCERCRPPTAATSASRTRETDVDPCPLDSNTS